MTVQACHQHKRLPDDLAARVDRLIMGIRLVPTIGRYDEDNDVFDANLGGVLRVTYRVTMQASPLVVILQIRPLSPEWAQRLELTCLAAS